MELRLTTHYSLYHYSLRLSWMKTRKVQPSGVCGWCWDPGYHVAKFDHHQYGEYLYILEGTFVDQNQASGPGTYIHNRPGSEHQPHTPDGCTFLVFIPGKRSE